MKSHIQLLDRPVSGGGLADKSCSLKRFIISKNICRKVYSDFQAYYGLKNYILHIVKEHSSTYNFA